MCTKLAFATHRTLARINQICRWISSKFCVISEPFNQVSSTVNYLKQKHDELKSTRISAASLSSPWILRHVHQVDMQQRRSNKRLTYLEDSWKQWSFKKVSKFCCSNVGCECMLLLVLSGGSQALNELKQKLQDLRVRSWDMTSSCNLQGFSNWIGDLFDFIVLIDCLLLAYLFVSVIPSMAHDYVFARATLAYWLFQLWCSVHVEIFNRENIFKLPWIHQIPRSSEPARCELHV